MSVFESITKGLQEAIDYEAGKPVKVRTKKMTITPPPQYEAADIKRIRASLKLSQIAFSGVLGVSVKTVEAWEAGKNVPQGPALRMLDLLKENPEIIERYIEL